MIPRALMLGLDFALGLAGACFQAPQPAVQFSCEPSGADDCPEGYTCEADGCCHLDGSSFEDHEGECQLGGAVIPTASSTGNPTGTGSTGLPTSDATDSPTTDGTSDGTGETTSGTTAGSSEGGSEVSSGSSGGSSSTG